MWILLALLSALFLGFYDISKKRSLVSNNVLVVLFLNTLFCSILFLPIIFNIPKFDFQSHLYVILKSFIVLSSWIMGYFALKNLPLTIAAPINAIRPIFVLLGAVLLFSESLNVYQWVGVGLSIFSLFLMSVSGKKEGIVFYKNKWIYILFGAVIMGAISGLYDKFIMRILPPLFVQSWFNIYQVIIMGSVLLLFKGYKDKFEWRWSIVFISIFISIADLAYFYALSSPDALISVVSMIRRGSVIVAFSYGAIVLNDKNIKSKAIDLVFIIAGLILLCIGSIL